MKHLPELEAYYRGMQLILIVTSEKQAAEYKHKKTDKHKTPSQRGNKHQINTNTATQTESGILQNFEIPPGLEGGSKQGRTPRPHLYPPSYLDHAFFVIRGGEGGGEILEEAGTFSGQALLLSYPYSRGGGVQSRRQAPTHRLVHSTYPISNHPHTTFAKYFHDELSK